MAKRSETRRKAAPPKPSGTIADAATRYKLTGKDKTLALIDLARHFHYKNEVENVKGKRLEALAAEHVLGEKMAQKLVKLGQFVDDLLKRCEKAEKDDPRFDWPDLAEALKMVLPHRTNRHRPQK